MKLRLTLMILAVLSFMKLSAQQVSLSGVVVDSTGDPLVGVSVQAGEGGGTVTDLDGLFKLNVKTGATVSFSYVGYDTKTITAKSGLGDLRIVLEEKATLLDEVVAIGYGVQKKKLVTGATLQVKGDEISARNTVDAVGALQGQTPGMNITALDGRPNSGFKVNIRGVGTNGDTNPIVVIDGLVGGMDNLQALNPNDIESLDVLKDAASTAIYGARAANGVILVTTKHGAEGRTNITFDAYVGWQNVAKRPQVLNAQEYMYMQDLAQILDGKNPYNWANLLDPNDYAMIQEGWQGTDWFDVLVGKDAPQQNYNFGVSGGSAMGSYSIGIGYTSQEGTMLRDYIDSKFERYTARINSDWNLIKHKDFNLLKFGQNLMLNYNKNHGLGAYSSGGVWGNQVRSTLTAAPIFSPFDEDGNMTKGSSLSPTQFNPLRLATRGGAGQDENSGYSARGNFFLQLEPIKNLVIRTNFGFGYSGWGSRSYSEPYNDGAFGMSSDDTISQSSGNNVAWSWENTIAYNFSVGKNNISALLGTSAEKWGYGHSLGASRTGNSFGDFLHAYLGNATDDTQRDKWSVWGSPSGKGAINSYFGRVSWDYDGKYMATATLRADGSSNFARGHRWGYFPSFSAGWNIDQEKFMESSRDWLNQLKLRASWGQNGNCNVANFQYLATIGVGWANYFFGDDIYNMVIGSYPNKVANPDLSWERSDQWDIGVDARFLNNRLGLTFDWYRKMTKDWLVTAPVLGSWGTGAPTINGGDVLNQGVELALNWNDKVGDFGYSVGVNMAYNKNEVTNLASNNGYIDGPGDAILQNNTFISRIEKGMPIGFFYGYKTLGVFQNQAQIDNYTGAKVGVTRPGDLIFFDKNGDGEISNEDKMMIGDPHPDVTLGVNLQFFYKGFDLGVSGYGAFGHQIASSYRDHCNATYDNWTMALAKQVWTGEGTSNRYPRPASASHENWQYMSDIYVDDADFFRIQNITLGYDFKSLIPKMPLSQCRFYVSINNLHTFTKYKGFSPEIAADGNWGGTSWAQGVDQGNYPMSRTFLIGVNLKY